MGWVWGSSAREVYVYAWGYSRLWISPCIFRTGCSLLPGMHVPPKKVVVAPGVQTSASLLPPSSPAELWPEADCSTSRSPAVANLENVLFCNLWGHFSCWQEHTKAASDAPSATVASFISEHNSNGREQSDVSVKALHETFLPKELLCPGTINAMDALPVWGC